MFCPQAPLNIKTNVEARIKKKENLIHVFTVNPVTHNAHKNVLPTQVNTASKSCRFISVCKNSQWAISFTGITISKG